MIKSSLCKKLLGIKFDYEKVNVKLKALSRVVPYVGLASEKEISNEFAVLITIELNNYMKDVF